MNPTELLELAKSTPTVAFHKFVLLSRGKTNDLFCFFEGKDCQYYSLRIKQIVKRNYHPISCGNKKTVLQTYNLFKNSEEYKSHLKAFFIDRDFDESIADSNVFETPCYSVENFYVNEYTISEVLKNEFLLTEADKEFETILNLFKRENEIFNNETLLFNSWYSALKTKKRKESLKSTNVSLDEKLPKNFICIRIGEIKSQYDLNLIKSTFPEAIEVSDIEVNQEMEKLRCDDLNTMLRGKFQMWFLYNFLQFLIEDANSKNTILKAKTKYRADKPNLCSNLSQYAFTPDCLIEYLSKFN